MRRLIGLEGLAGSGCLVWVDIWEHTMMTLDGRLRYLQFSYNYSLFVPYL
jgi:hypothetical protein